MNETGGAGLALLTALVLFGSRRSALAAMLAGMLYLPQAQSFSVASIHLFPMRALEIVALVRISVRNEWAGLQGNRIDRAVQVLYVYTVAVFAFRSEVDRVYVLGIAVDALLCYAGFRVWLKTLEDLEWLLARLVWLVVPFVGLLTVEMVTGDSPFRLVGGLTFVERGDRLRCMGSFRHPSLLGTVGAAFLPLYVALWCVGGRASRSLLGLCCCVAIIVLSNSGGPLSAAMFGCLGWAAWPLRRRMRGVRRGLLALMLMLAVFMKAPIWYLPAKASSFSGGDGWHRSYLMDVAFRRMDSWWLAGIDMASTRNWFDYTLAATGSADITNQYLFFGLTAGVVAIGLFLLLLVRAWSVLGAGLAAVRAGPGEASGGAEHMLWGLGCCLLVHTATWFGITYNFDQTYVIWFLQLAAISSLSSALPAPSRSGAPARDRGACALARGNKVAG